MRWLLVVALCGCSALYDASEFGLCQELPTYEVPPCPLMTFSCLVDTIPECQTLCGDDDDCADDCLIPCYDANADGVFDDAETTCFSCVAFVSPFRCVADNGCADEVEAAFCCSDAICDPRGCADDQCSSEIGALNQCIIANIDDTTCQEAALPCFQDL